jgi:hypothetical protein
MPYALCLPHVLRLMPDKRKWNVDARVSGGTGVSAASCLTPYACLMLTPYACPMPYALCLPHDIRLKPDAVCRTAYLRMPDAVCLTESRCARVCGGQVARTALLLIDKRLKVETLVPDSLGLAAGGAAVGGDRRSGGGERGGGVGAHILSAMFPDDESQGGVRLTNADVC